MRAKSRLLFLVRNFLRDLELHETCATLESELEQQEIEYDVDQVVLQHATPLLGIMEEWETWNTTKQMNHLVLDKRVDQDLAIPSTLLGKSLLQEKTLSFIHTKSVLSIQHIVLPASLFPLHPCSQHALQLLATSSSDRQFKLTCIETGVTVETMQYPVGPILTLDQHPLYPHILLTGGMDAEHHIVDITTKASIQGFKDHQKYVVRALFSPCADMASEAGDWFATGSYDRTVRLYKRNTSATTLQYQHVKTLYFRGAVESLCFLPGNMSRAHRIVVGTRGDCCLHTIELMMENEQEELNFRHVSNSLNENGDDWVSFSPMSLSCSPNGHHVAVTTDSQSGLVLICRTPLYNESVTTLARRLYLPSLVTPDEYDRVECCWTRENTLLVSSTGSHFVFEYKMDESDCLMKNQGAWNRSFTHSEPIRHCSVSYHQIDGQNRTLVALAGSQGDVKLYF